MRRRKKTSKDDDDIPDWVVALLGLGVGALAVAALIQLSSGNSNQPPDKCPHCGAAIRKWARECPVCRRPLTWK